MANVPALIDTGATITCISAPVAAQLNLLQLGMRNMSSALGSQPVPTYFGDLIIPMTSGGGYVVHGMELLEFQPGGAPIQMLIGRDVLCRGVLTMSFDGHFTFSV